jgi:hypothetical protein
MYYSFHSIPLSRQGYSSLVLQIPDSKVRRAPDRDLGIHWLALAQITEATPLWRAFDCSAAKRKPYVPRTRNERRQSC